MRLAQGLREENKKLFDGLKKDSKFKVETCGRNTLSGLRINF